METLCVAVKTASEECGAHEMLMREARAYARFPRVLMEGHTPAPPPGEKAESDGKTASEQECEPEFEVDTKQVASKCDSNDPLTFAPSKSASAENQSANDISSKKDAEDKREPPMVPKFFGFYAPATGDSDEPDLRMHRSCHEDSQCCVTWPTALLLVEQCGSVVHAHKLKLEHRCVVSARCRIYIFEADVGKFQ